MPKPCFWTFDFGIVNFALLDGDVPRSTSYEVYISQPIRFSRASSHIADFNTRNKLLTMKLLKKKLSVSLTLHFIVDTMIPNP